MNRIECAWQTDVLDAVASRRWPDRCDADLREHLATCASCADLAQVASALLEDGHVAADAARIPEASIVWWRAQVRARQGAARVALLPIGTVQGVALACGVLVAVVALWLSWPSLATFVGAIPGIQVPVVDVDVAGAVASASAALANRGVQAAIGASLLLAPVALYLAVAGD